MKTYMDKAKNNKKGNNDDFKILTQEEVIEIARNESCRLKEIAEEMLENTLTPLEESINLIQSGLKNNFFKKKNNFISSITNKSIRKGLKAELDEQLQLYLESIRIFTLIMKMSKNYYDDLSLVVQDMFYEFKEEDIIKSKINS